MREVATGAGDRRRHDTPAAQEEVAVSPPRAGDRIAPTVRPAAIEQEVAASGPNFVRALARRVGTRVVLYVPCEGDARSLWISEAHHRTDLLADVEQRGRRFLDALTQGRSVPDDADPTVALATVRSSRAGLLGAVVVVKDDRSTWTDEQRALVRFAVDFYGPMLDDRATPPPEIHTSSEWQRASDALEAGMRDAVGRGELRLVYQPEFDLVTHRVHAVEALARWQHPVHGELGPDSFIALAERSDLIKVVGAWVIDESTRALASWIAQLPGLDVVLRVNVSPVQMHGDELVELFEAALTAHRIPGRQLCIELTENAPLRDLDQVADTLARLKRMGISSAIDDLASGYSTLSQMRSLPVDIIKIDRSLVSNIDRDERAEAIVMALIGLALNFGLEVVAEGVETPAEMATLVRLGCTRAQGHYLGRPMPAAELLEMLRERGSGATRSS